MQEEWIVPLPNRLDVFLSLKGGISRTQAQEAIEAGNVDVNDGTVVKSSFRLKEGDKVVYKRAEGKTKTAFSPTDLNLSVLYEDDACMVIDKPDGIAVHPGPAMPDYEKTILHGIAFLFEKQSIPFSSDAVLVHRLDRETTGCLLIAKTKDAHEFLQQQFEERTVQKTYLALVSGIPSPKEAMIDAPVGRSLVDRTKMSLFQTGKSRAAQTAYEVIAEKSLDDDSYVKGKRAVALVACQPHTGRTHQIRVHLRSIGHPILGDGTYYDSLSDRLTQDLSVQSLLLHAWKLQFVSPKDSKTHTVEAPLSHHFRNILERLDIEIP